jgi:hypothetical protein
MLYARGTTPQAGCAMQSLGQDVTDNHSINPEQMCVSDNGVLSLFHKEIILGFQIGIPLYLSYKESYSRI